MGIRVGNRMKRRALRWCKSSNQNGKAKKTKVKPKESKARIKRNYEKGQLPDTLLGIE